MNGFGYGPRAGGSGGCIRGVSPKLPPEIWREGEVHSLRPEGMSNKDWEELWSEVESDGRTITGGAANLPAETRARDISYGVSADISWGSLWVSTGMTGV